MTPRRNKRRNFSCTVGLLQNLPQRRSGAFSLVEVVLAVGVAAFALIPIMGLMPVALKVGHDAIDASRVAKITQEVANDLVQMGHSRLISSSLPMRYFNYDGIEIEAGEDSHYSVVANFAGGVRLPGASQPSGKLALVQLEIFARGEDQPIRAAVTVPDSGL